jgi:hypothetical protein
MGNDEDKKTKNPEESIKNSQISTNKNEIKNNNNINPSINQNINSNSDIKLKANPVKKKKRKKRYDLSQFEIREQIQETFIETIPIKVRKQDPSYYELKNGEITHAIPPCEIEDSQNKRRRRPLRNRKNIGKIDVSNQLGNSENADLVENNEGQVLIIVPMTDGSQWVREYDKGDPIQYIVEDFKDEKGVEIPEDSNLDWKFNENPLDFNAKIESLVPKLQPTVFLDLEIEHKGLDLNLDDEEVEDEITDVAKPFNNPFEVYLFNKQTRTFQILNFSNEDLENSEIDDKYNLSSSYCNGNNHLYISGGENSTNDNKFWDINLQNNSIKTYKLPDKKKNHSMIYVPNKYVFIIGGNDKHVYYYDTEAKEINKWADLNEIHIEPTLGLYKNKEIYVFSNNDDKLQIEKTDLTKKKPSWEKIEPNFEDDLKFEQKFSGISLKGNKFIFLGGDIENNENEFNCLYDINKNLIKKSNVKFKKFNLKEKTFLKYNNSIDFILSDFNKGKPEVLFFKKNKNLFESIRFSPKGLNNQQNSANKNKLKNSRKFNFDMPKYDMNMNHEINSDNEQNDEDENSSNNYEVNNEDDKFEDDFILKQSKINLKNSKIESKPKTSVKNKKNDSKFKNYSQIKKRRNKDINKRYKSAPYRCPIKKEAIKYIQPLFIIDNSINFKKEKIQIKPNQTSLNKNVNSEPNNIIIDNVEINTNTNENNDIIEQNIVKTSKINKINEIQNQDEPQYDGNVLHSSIILNNSIGSQKKSALPIVGDNKSSRNKIASSFIDHSKSLNKNDINENNLGNSINVGISGKKAD